MPSLTTQSNDHEPETAPLQRSAINRRSHCAIRFAARQYLMPPIFNTDLSIQDPAYILRNIRG
jgi:hypothetical protein